MKNGAYAIILFLSLSIVSLGCVSNNNADSQIADAQKNEYMGFKFPFEVDQSLLSSGAPVIKNEVQKNWITEFDAMNLNNGWNKINESYYLDGGSQMISYYKSNNDIAVDLFYKWDMQQGKWTSLTITVTKKEDVAKWLEKINQEKAMKNDI